MVNTTEQILLTLGARNNASNVFGQVDKDAKSMASSISSTISNLNNGLMNIGSVTDNMMQGLTGKSAMDNILGTTSKAETNSVLLKNMLDDAEKHYDSFYEKVDKTTDSSLTSMQELIPALKAFKSATGATDKEITNITDEMANFGAAVLAQTGSTDLAQQSMMDLSKGVKGAFASLDQYGITQDALERTGYWNGDEKDVEGFMKAVQKVTGSTEELMETNTGLDALIGKAFSRAGKKMGNEFLPWIKDIKRGFLDLDSELDGNLTASMLAVSGGVEVMNQGLWNVSTTVNGVKDLAEAFHSVKDGASIALDTIKSFRNTTETVTSATQTASVLSDLSPEAIQAAQAHAGGNFLKDNSSEYIQDMLDHQISSIDDADYRTALLEKKYEDLDIKSNRLNDVSTKTSKNLEKSQSKGLFSKFFKNTEETVESAASVGALAPEATAASVGVGETAVATTGLSASFTAMIVPLLALSAVIAIMIPIAVALAAEALLGLKAIQMVFEALDFGGIDLEDDISGIKQLAEGMAWIGGAMAAMTFASIMTGLAVITGGFLGILGPLDIAVNALKEAGQKLSQFNSVTIDPSVGAKIKTISETLASVSEAMGSLTWNNIVTGFSNFVANLLGFGSVTDGLEQAKNDIIKASEKLNEFSGITPLEDSVATNIQNVCNSLASVGDAMNALRSIRDSQNWDSMIGDFVSGIFGEGVDIQTALMNVKDDIIKASQALAQFTGISEIPDDISSKIQKVGSTLTTVNETVTTIKEMVGSGFDNWVEGLFGGYDVAGGLEKIKTDLITASQKLAELSGLSEIDESISEKITKVGNALTKVNEVSTTLTSLGSSGIGEFDSSIIATAVTNVKTAATELAKLNEVTFDGATADTMLGAIKTTLENVKTTLSAASGFTEASTSIGSQIVNGVRSGLTPLSSTVIGAVSSATNAAGSVALAGGASIATTINNGFSSTLNLHTTMETEMGYVTTAVNNGISAAKTAAENGAKDVVAAFKSGINVGSPGDIARTMNQEMAYTYDFLKRGGSLLTSTMYDVARDIVSSFGNPSLGMGMFTNGGQLTAEHIGALKTTISNAPDKTDNRPVTIIVSEGAVKLDARNYTTKEAQGLMITALEGMDHITNIDVDGV